MNIESLQGPWPWARTVGYAQAVQTDGLIMTGGIGPYDAEGRVIDAGFEDQVRQTFGNLEAVLGEFGADLTNVVSMNVFVADPAHYVRFTVVRPEFLTAPYPASTAVGTALLAEGMQIEVNAVARLGAVRVTAPPA